MTLWPSWRPFDGSKILSSHFTNKEAEVLGDSRSWRQPRRTGKTLSFDVQQTWIQIQTSCEWSTWSLSNYLASLSFGFLFSKTQDNDSPSPLGLFGGLNIILLGTRAQNTLAILFLLLLYCHYLLLLLEYETVLLLIMVYTQQVLASPYTTPSPHFPEVS